VSDRVLLAVPGLGVLALPLEVYREALAAGAALTTTTPTSPSDPELLDTEQLAMKLKKPASWVEDRARRGLIPAKKAGRSWRFDATAVVAALANGESAEH
jgi:hypothetical protein